LNDKIEYNQKKFNHLKKKYWANLGEGFIECKKHETLFKENGEFCQYCLDKTKKKRRTNAPAVWKDTLEHRHSTGYSVKEVSQNASKQVSSPARGNNN